jgi:3-oxoadipate enol-lactonase
MAFISVEPGLRLYCEVDDYLWPWQQATPVIMIHGYARNAGFWRRWVPIVSAERRVYRPELRGFGRSDVPPEDHAFDLQTLVRDLAKVLDHFEVPRAHFVGEASGGMLSVLFGLEYPQRVASLVLCDTALDAAQAIGQTNTEGAATPGDAIRKHGVGEWCRRTLQNRLDVRTASTDLQEWVVSEMDKTPAFMGAALNDLVRVSPSLAPSLENLPMPVLLLTGDRSARSGYDQDAFTRRLPNGRHHVFQGYGHGVSVILPEECAREAQAFWKAL